MSEFPWIETCHASASLIRSRLTYVTLVVLLTSAVEADASVLVNGSFEANALLTPDRVAMNQLQGWQSAGGFMLLERGVNGTSGIAAFDGFQFVSFGHSGAFDDRLFQTISTNIGVTYKVDFYVASIQGNAFQRMRASAYDSSNAEIGFTNSDVNLAGSWVAGKTLVFTATTSATRLEFKHTVAAGGANMALDKVVIASSGVAAVPEPSSLFTFLAGCLSVGIHMRGWRRRRV